MLEKEGRCAGLSLQQLVMREAHSAGHVGGIEGRCPIATVKSVSIWAAVWKRMGYLLKTKAKEKEKRENWK